MNAEPVPCAHLDTIRPVHPHTRGCEECLKIEPGEDWKWCYIDQAAWE